jgi:hypothetical protein
MRVGIPQAPYRPPYAGAGPGERGGLDGRSRASGSRDAPRRGVHPDPVASSGGERGLTRERPPQPPRAGSRYQRGTAEVRRTSTSPARHAPVSGPSHRAYGWRGRDGPGATAKPPAEPQRGLYQGAACWWKPDAATWRPGPGLGTRRFNQASAKASVITVTQGPSTGWNVGVLQGFLCCVTLVTQASLRGTARRTAAVPGDIIATAPIVQASHPFQAVRLSGLLTLKPQTICARPCQPTSSSSWSPASSWAPAG